VNPQQQGCQSGTLWSGKHGDEGVCVNTKTNVAEKVTKISGQDFNCNIMQLLVRTMKLFLINTLLAQQSLN
jgi:hypothetical protein